LYVGLADATSFKAIILVFDTDSSGCKGKPSKIGDCSKMGTGWEKYSCDDNKQVMIQECTDAMCTQCGAVTNNPYGYTPDQCTNDYLKVTCTSNAQTLHTTGGTSGKGSAIEQAAKNKLATMGAGSSDDADDDDQMEAQESEVKAKMTMKAAPASDASSAESSAKERLRALQNEL